MSGVIESLERAQLRRVPRFQAGDRLKVHFQVVEGTRRRTQVFEGVVIKRQGSGARETFTVRKQSFGVGVERTFPLHSPKIERIEVASRGDVRRAKLYYLRGRVGRRARVRERQYAGADREAELFLMEPEGAADAEGTQAEAAPVLDQAEAAEDEAGEGGGEAGEDQAAAEEDAAPSGDKPAGDEGRPAAEEPAAEQEAEAEASGDEPPTGDASAETEEGSEEAGAKDAGSNEP